MRRSQAKSHCPILSKVMDVEEPEVKKVVVDLLSALLWNGRQRRQVERLRQGRNIAHDPIVRRRERQHRRCLVRPWLHSERRLHFGHFYRLMEELRLEDGGLLQKFPEDGVCNV